MICAALMAQQRFQQLLEFLTTLNQVNGDSPNTLDQRRRLLRSCLQDFMSGPVLEMSAGTAMLREVQDSSIPQWMKDDVITAVENKMCQNESVGKKARHGLQKNMFLFNYFGEKEWGVLMSENKGLDPKLQVIKGRCVAIGLTHPTEPTCVLANAILHLASHTGAIEDFQVDKRKAFGLLKEIKTLVKLGSKRACHSGIAIYPADPQDLPQQLRDRAYQNEPAVQCPLDVSMIQELATTLPARDTHHDIRAKHSFKSRSQCDDNMGSMVGSLLCNGLLAGLFQGGGSGLNGLNGVNLQMLGNGAQKRKYGQLAIEDGKLQVDEAGTKPEDKNDQEPNAVQSAEASKPKGIDGMAAIIADQLVANSSEKNGKATKPTKSKGKANAKASAKSKVKQVASGGSASLKSLVFPGTAGRDPIYFGDVATIYTCPKSSNWRVKKNTDKKDKAFSWKKEDPKLVWTRVVKYVEALSK